MILVLEHEELDVPSINNFQMSLTLVRVYHGLRNLGVSRLVPDFGGVFNKDILNGSLFIAYVSVRG